MTLKETAQHEGEKAAQEQKYDDENIGDRRGEIAAHLPFGDGLNIRPGRRHFVASLAVSGRVIVRNTSSKRPSSVCNSSIFQPPFTLISPTLRASSPFLFEVCGYTRAHTLVESSFTMAALRALEIWASLALIISD